MTRCLIAFVVGVLCLHSAPHTPSLLTQLTLPVLALACLRASPALSAWVVGFLFATFVADGALDDRWPTARHGETIEVTGVIVSLVDRGRARGQRFVFRSDPGQGVPSRIRVGWYLETPAPRPGEQWRLALRMQSPRGLLNPVGFDHERWSVARRFGAYATVRTHPPPLRLAPAANGIPALRGAVDARLTVAMARHARAEVVRGLVLGERSGLDRAEWEVFARTGTAHLMAISGLHVGIVASCAFIVMRRLAGGGSTARLLATLAGVTAAACYAVLAGWSVPTRRALTMIAVAALVLLARRQVMPFAVWVLAIAVVVATDPLSPLTIGFWLSFGAVAAIAWAFAYRRWSNGASALLRVQWAVSLGLLPATMWFFQRGSLVSPLVNLLAVPVFSVVVVPGALIGAVIAMLAPGSVAELPLRLVLYLLESVWFLLEQVAAWPWAQRFTPQPPLWTVILGTIAAIVALAPGPRVFRFAVALSLAAPMVAWHPAPLSVGAWRLTLLDVGQGLAAIVRTRQHTLVYDAGPSWGPDADAGSRIVVPYLRATGVSQPDLLILSHPHDDHTGGARSLEAAFGSIPVLAGASPGQPRCRAGHAWTWDGVRFRFLHPGAESPLDPNLASCVLEVRGEHARLLLTGDIEWPAELELSRQPSPLSPVDVVVVPHHGSATSSTHRLVRAIRPRYALVPAGYANRWRFPDPEIRARWAAAGAEVHIVGPSGGLVVETTASGELVVDGARARRRAWWRVP